MNGLRSALSEFFLDLKAQKLRTALTIFGIVWGTVAIVVLLAFGMGFKKQLSINMHGIGESIAIMFPGSTTRAYEGFGIGRPIRLVEEDAWMLAREVRTLREVCPEYSGEVQLRVGENIINTSAGGVYTVYGGMRNILPAAGGRFINEMDLRERRRVVFLGNETKKLLFGEGEAIGKLVYVGTVPFTVIGVMQKKIQNSSYNRRDQDRVYMPATTYASLYGETHVRNIIFTPKDPRSAEATIASVREVLGKKYRFDPADHDAVFIWDTGQFDRFIFYFFLAFNIFMGVIGGFTLGVGGIGVANIMFIVVQERIKEIGIRRAVGARKSHIMAQFFLETLAIIALGSSVGFLIALGIAKALQYVPIKDFVGTPVVSWEVALATALVLGAVALSAGLFPARRAANLNIVDCLRA